MYRYRQKDAGERLTHGLERSRRMASVTERALSMYALWFLRVRGCSAQILGALFVCDAQCAEFTADVIVRQNC